MSKYKCVTMCQYPAEGRVYEVGETVDFNAKDVPVHFKLLNAKTKKEEPEILHPEGIEEVKEEKRKENKK